MILIYVVAAWVVGILVASLVHLPTQVWLMLLVIPLGYLLLFWRNPALLKWHIVLLCFVLGALRFQLALPSELDKQLELFNEQGKASLVGIVVTEPDIRQTQALVRVDVSKIQTNGEWLDTSGLALVSVPRDTPVKYGDEVQVDGVPETPPDDADFSYRDYLARSNIFTLIRNARLYVVTSGRGSAFWATLYAFKNSAEQAIAQLLPEPSASLLTGILLGDDSGIPPDLAEAFSATNTAHIIAISGYNIAVLIGVLMFLFRRPSDILRNRAMTVPTGSIWTRVTTALLQHLTTILILLFLILYTLLVGASASVVRACIMGGLVVIALDLGRQSWAFNALAIAAFLMTLLNPYVLWDVGFQLSFLATLGLLIYVPRLQSRLDGALKKRVNDTRARQIADFFRDALLVTTAAFIVTAPLIVAYFHRLSLIGFLTNFLVLPVQSPIMVLGGAATLLQMAANALTGVPILGLVLGAAAQMLAWGAYICLQYTILIVQATAAIPFGSFQVERIDAPLVIAFYAALFVGTRLGVKRATGLFLSRVWVAIAFFALTVMFVWTTAVATRDPRTRIAFVASSAGDATFIRTANDHRILINGTTEPGTLLSFLGTQLPPWDRRLDAVFVTHLDDENLAALNAVLERHTVAQVVEPTQPLRPGVSYTKWRELVKANKIQVVPALQGATLRAGEVTLQVVYPSAEADTSSVVLQMMANGRTFLFAPSLRQADRDALAENELVSPVALAVLPNDVETDLLKQIEPATVLLFAGKSARDKPDDATLKALANTTVLRTDERGTIQYILDGDTVVMQSDK